MTHITGPGADLASALLSTLDGGERADVARWALDFGPAEARAYITGYFQGRFWGNGHSLVALANAARAVANNEVPL